MDNFRPRHNEKIAYITLTWHVTRKMTRWKVPWYIMQGICHVVDHHRQRTLYNPQLT